MSRTGWPMLPENVQFNAFDDENQVLDFVLSLEKPAQRIFFDAMDNSPLEDVVFCAITAPPTLYVVIMKIVDAKDGGLILLLSRDETSIYSHMERLKEENPKEVAIIDFKMTQIREQMRIIKEMNKI